MAIEYRNGRPYYYRKKRRGKQVISEYAGSGELAEIMAALDGENKQEKDAEQQKRRLEQAQNCQADEELLQFESTLQELFTSLALANGYHKPKRQWRKKRQK